MIPSGITNRDFIIDIVNVFHFCCELVSKCVNRSYLTNTKLFRGLEDSHNGMNI